MVRLGFKKRRDKTKWGGCARGAEEGVGGINTNEDEFSLQHAKKATVLFEILAAITNKLQRETKSQRREHDK